MELTGVLNTDSWIWMVTSYVKAGQTCLCHVYILALSVAVSRLLYFCRTMVACTCAHCIQRLSMVFLQGNRKWSTIILRQAEICFVWTNRSVSCSIRLTDIERTMRFTLKCITRSARNTFPWPSIMTFIPWSTPFEVRKGPNKSMAPNPSKPLAGNKFKGLNYVSSI